MNADLTTTIAGIVAGICTLLGYFNIIIPQSISAAIVAIMVAILGYFIAKPVPPKK